jgi:hypothetical protein
MSTAPKRVVEGTVQGFVRDENGCVVAVYIDSQLGLVNVSEPFMSFAGKRVRLTVEVVSEETATPPDEIDIDGFVDEERNICYFGTATRQPNGKYIALASVAGNMCRVECSITFSGELAKVVANG